MGPTLIRPEQAPAVHQVLHVIKTIEIFRRRPTYFLPALINQSEAKRKKTPTKKQKKTQKKKKKKAVHDDIDPSIQEGL